MSALNKIILAGAFARSNMGHAVDPATMRDALKYPPRSLSGSVMRFCEPLMETDEHQEMFEDEGRMWEKKLGSMTDEEIEKTWPDLIQVYREAEEAIQ